MIDAAVQLAGGALALLALYDLYRTVLVPGGRGGPVSRAVSRAVWAIARLGGGRAMAQAGPLIVVGGVAAWGALLTVGYALVTWPALGEGVTATGGGDADGLLLRPVLRRVRFDDAGDRRPRPADRPPSAC